MSFLGRPSFVRVVAGAIVILTAGAVHAQFIPYYPYEDMVGGWALASSTMQNAANQRSYSQNRDLQSQTASQKSAAWQQINSSMASQAQMRTQSMNDQRQSGRDWWYRQQESQIAQRQVARSQPLPVMSAPAKLASQTTKSAQREIMLWPTLLKSQTFSADRAAVEAPFRRAYAGGPALGAADYKAIIAAVEKMKTALKSMSGELIESEYESVDRYLDQLLSDAQERIRSDESPEKQSADAPWMTFV